MRTVTPKVPADIKLAGITVELMTNEHGNPRRITLRDAVGGFLEVTCQYGLEAHVPAPPVMVDRWILSGLAFGIKVREVFASDYLAGRRKDALEEYAVQTDGGTCVLTVEKVTEPDDAPTCDTGAIPETPKPEVAF